MLLLASIVAADPDIGWASFMFGAGARETEAVHLVNVTGSFPTWLDGVWLQNGPGKWEWSGRSFTSSGDGYGKVEAVDIGESGVEYTSLFTKSSWWNKSC